jgi:branched-chain amino acid transport system substrate-binding protein
VAALGQEVCQGLVLTNSFYWNLSDKTRAWTKRYVAAMGTPPTMLHAANYASIFHWLRAAKAANTLDADAVAAKMHAMPLEDFYHDNIPVQPNGQSLDTIHVWQVKPPAASRSRWDFYAPVATIAGKDAFMPLAETGCRLV